MDERRQEIRIELIRVLLERKERSPSHLRAGNGGFFFLQLDESEDTQVKPKAAALDFHRYRSLSASQCLLSVQAIRDEARKHGSWNRLTTAPVVRYLCLGEGVRRIICTAIHARGFR